MDKRKELAQLVALAGSTRKAEKLIKEIKGVSPTHSAIHKAINGSGSDYTILSCIVDLKQALSQ